MKNIHMENFKMCNHKRWHDISNCELCKGNHIRYRLSLQFCKNMLSKYILHLPYSTEMLCHTYTCLSSSWCSTSVCWWMKWVDICQRQIPIVISCKWIKHFKTLDWNCQPFIGNHMVLSYSHSHPYHPSLYHVIWPSPLFLEFLETIFSNWSKWESLGLSLT